MKRHFLTTIFLCLGLLSFAAKETFTERIAASALVEGSITDLFDQQFVAMSTNPSWGSSFYNHSVKNKVWIGYEPDHFPTADVDHTISLQIDYWTYNSGTSAFVQTTVTKDLEISFRADGQLAMQDMSTFVLVGAHRIKVTVLDIDGANAGNIFVASEIEVERYYNIPTTALTGVDDRYLGTGDEYLEFFWDPLAGAESYELEWTFISNHDYNTSTNTASYDDPADLNFDFYENSTRVNVKSSYYQIPAIFNRGYVIYRVRAIGRQGSTYQYRKEGEWSLAVSGNVAALTSGVREIESDYEADKNWQHQVSYTEDGKRFESVSFADGFGRGRQSVSHNTQTRQAVVSNVYYDRIGRPVVSDLPTPVDGEVLKHYPNFNYGVDLNLLTADAPYGLAHYDYDLEAVCLPPTNPFSSTYGEGAGIYYSNVNSDKEGANKNIPDAGGYPFAQVEYMNDQTGRIRRTGGYGADHQLNEHSTQYFYDTPLQEELNKLFGTEVGWNKHYKRTITVDANGQAYASYYDLAGRVIASCLIGDSPGMLDGLDNNGGPVIEESPLYEGFDKQVFNSGEGIISYSFPYTVITEADYTIDHTFTPSEFTDGCLPEGFCYDCFYDLDISVDDPLCGVNHYSTQVTINGWEVDALCNGEGYEGSNWLMHLTPGQYMISKTLRVSEGAAEAYWCNYVSNSTCTPDYAALYNAAYEDTDFGCVYPIDAGDMNNCEKYRRLMAADMSIGGQYGSMYDISDPGAFDLSIYKENNDLPNGGDWRNPDGHYLDEDGNEVWIYITGQTGAYTPAVDDELEIQTDGDGNKYIYPENLAQFTDYMQYWRSSWALALVKYHPEYCYLQFCDENLDFHLYDQALESTDHYDVACESGYMDPILTGAMPSPNTMNYYQGCNTSEDTFFTSSEWGDIEDLISPDLSYNVGIFEDTLEVFYLIDGRSNRPLSLWQYAVWKVHCDDPSLTYTQVIECIEAAELNACEKDLVWLRFRDEYRKLRNDYYLIAQTMYVSYPSSLAGGGCGPAFNGCIGNSSYDPADLLKYGFSPAVHLSATGTATPVTDLTGPCASTTAASYALKIPRFVNLPAEGYTYPGVTMTPTGIEDYINDLVEAQCASVCESYADEWMEKLKACYTDPDVNATQYNTIRAALIEVCVNGCSAENPGGSTTAPGSTLTYETFAEVLGGLGTGYPSTECSEYLISSPRPSGQNDIEVAPSNILDNCGCDKLLNAQYSFENMGTEVPPGVTSVEHMLKLKYNFWMEDASLVICACEQSFDGSWTPGATWNSTGLDNLEGLGIPVPEELRCETCKTCEEVQEITDDFHSEFPAYSATNPDHDVLFENYMNTHLGYHLGKDEYDAFLETCGADSETPTCTTTGLGRVFKDLLNVIARQGQLTTGSSNPYDMADANIVYQYSNLLDVFSSSDYWTCGTGCDPGTLVMNFGESPEISTAEFHLPTGADFDFGDIIGISDITAINACADDNIDLEVRVVVCGEIVTRHITGFSDLNLVKCYCASGTAELCDEPPYAPADPCYAFELMVLDNLTEDAFENQVEEQHTAFVVDYISKCSVGFETDVLTMTGPGSYYQFTLFYYDQAGNLVKTVAPKGALDNLFLASAGYADVDDNRTSAIANVPAHEYITTYKYNSYNQVISTSNPDQEGETMFFYDRYGRIVASYNPEQADAGQHSYTLYDVQGRPVETGQVSTASTLTAGILLADDFGSSFQGWVNSGTRTEVTRTQYDEPLSVAIDGLFTNGQEHLRLRVASVLYFNTVTSSTDLTEDYASAIHYSYDQHGNVKEQIQDVPDAAVVGQRIKRTAYAFELISGNVKTVQYQAGERDQMTHRYKYDKLNRLTDVFTSTDGGVHESRDGKYRYYDHGPLARTEIGQHKVQGMDYAYTINGWIKGMNSNTLKANRDMGRDGITGYLTSNDAVHENVAGDVAGYTLGYFQGDYTGIGTPDFEALVYTGNDLDNIQSQLYNGNISHLVTAIQGFEVQATSYRYDQLQRLKQMRVFRAADLLEDNSWESALETQEYKNSYSYDENGNILSLVRNGITANGLLMDDFTYDPQPLGVNPSNRLDRVQDNGADDATNTGDIKTGMVAGNYEYDKIGQLTADPSEGIDLIEWYSGSKKVKRIVRDNPDSPEMEFIYNPFGMRIVKIVKPRSGGILSTDDEWKYSYYTYDANGQVMAVYETLLNSDEKDVYLEEQHIYGAGRLGMTVPHKLIYSEETTITDPTEIWSHSLGVKHYEVTNYLGNVNAVITDRKTAALQTPTITDQENISVSGGEITRTLAGSSWGNCGGASVETVEQGGFMEWTIGGTSLDNNRYVTVGLSYTNADAHFNTIDYAWYTYTYGVNVYVGGNLPAGHVYGQYPGLAVGDVLKMERRDGNILFYQNSVLLYTSPDSYPQTPMIIDFAIVSGGRKIHDLKIQNSTNYEAVVVMKSDYYPFGMPMPGRNEEAGEYRYGYNGMEKDDEVKGAGNSYTTEFRQYDPRTGRWLSLDPLMIEFPWMSPYVGFDNNPVYYIDPYGLSATSAGDPPPGGAPGENKTPNSPILKDPAGPQSGRIDRGNPKTIDFGLFTVTFRIGQHSQGTDINKRGIIDFHWKYNLSLEPRKKIFYEPFVLDQRTSGMSTPNQNTINYPPDYVSGDPTGLNNHPLNKEGKTIPVFLLDPDIIDFDVESLVIETMPNDNGGESFYNFRVVSPNKNFNMEGGSKRTIKHSDLNILLTVINARLVGQRAGDGGRFDQCDGYVLTVLVKYVKYKKLKKLRINLRKPK